MRQEAKSSAEIESSSILRSTAHLWIASIIITIAPSARIVDPEEGDVRNGEAVGGGGGGGEGRENEVHVEKAD